jgi:hypothetical protein
VNQRHKVKENKSILLSTKKQDAPGFESINSVAAVSLYATRDEKFERLLLEPVANLQVC